jgi:hypothetical protein
VCLLTESANSRIFVQEGPARGQRLALRREAVVAFVGSSPRGSVSIPVALRGDDEYRRRFGAPGHRSRVQDMLAQFFDNGGTNAVFVRVSGSERRHRIVLPGADGNLVLNAINPGPHECLRVSVDYDGIPANEEQRFNIVVHRLASRDKPIVEEQEIYRSVSMDPGDDDFVVHALVESALVRIDGATPLMRPVPTRSPGVEIGASYAYADDDWREQASLTDYDLIGCDREGTGIFALDSVPTIDAICLVPDTEDVGPVALFAAERYCRRRDALLLVDPPSTWTCVADVVRDRMSSAFSSPNVVTCFPRPRVRPGTGLNRVPSVIGALVGRLLADEARQGTWALRGQDSVNFRCRSSLTHALDDNERRALNRVGVVALLECVGGQIQAAGLVTMDRSRGFDAAWSDLRLRRLGLHIVGTIARGTRWSAFDNDRERTEREVRRQVAAFMRELCAAGAFPAQDPDACWYIAMDSRAPADDATSPFTFTVGFAPKAGEVVAFRFEQDQLDCRVHPVGWQPRVALAS